MEQRRQNLMLIEKNILGLERKMEKRRQNLILIEKKILGLERKMEPRHQVFRPVKERILELERKMEKRRQNLMLIEKKILGLERKTEQRRQNLMWKDEKQKENEGNKKDVNEKKEIEGNDMEDIDEQVEKEEQDMLKDDSKLEQSDKEQKEKDEEEKKKERSNFTARKMYDRVTTFYTGVKETFLTAADQCLSLKIQRSKEKIRDFLPKTQEEKHFSRTAAPTASEENGGRKSPDTRHDEYQEQYKRKGFLGRIVTGTTKRQFHTPLLLLSLFVSLSSGSYQDERAYCHVHSEVNLPEWRLTCQFQEDLTESKQDFLVYHIKHEDFPDVVVDGTWIKDEPVVYTADGYTHEGLVSDKVVIRMKKDVVHHGGIFACFLPSVKLQDVKTCQIPQREELHSTQTITTQLHVPISSKGSRFGDLKVLLVVTVILISYETF